MANENGLFESYADDGLNYRIEPRAVSGLTCRSG